MRHWKRCMSRCVAFWLRRLKRVLNAYAGGGLDMNGALERIFFRPSSGRKINISQQKHQQSLKEPNNQSINAIKGLKRIHLYFVSLALKPFFYNFRYFTDPIRSCFVIHATRMFTQCCLSFHMSVTSRSGNGSKPMTLWLFFSGGWRMKKSRATSGWLMWNRSRVAFGFDP